jgi:DNA-binding transcriptional ArsR family regulator
MIIELIEQPDLEDITMTAVLAALSDEIRLSIVRRLDGGQELVCGEFELPVTKATRSHHLKVLREAGITRTRVAGKTRLVSLRRDDLDARFPGLLEAVLGAVDSPAQ